MEEIDVLKDTLTIPWWLAKMTFLCPGPPGTKKRIWTIIVVTIFVILEIGQMAYIMKNTVDPEDFVVSMATASTTFQATYKIIVLYRGGGSLKEILDTIQTKFWKSNLLATPKCSYIFGERLKLVMKLIYVIGITFAALIWFPAYNHSELPLKSAYPFDYSKSPVYEIISTLQGLCYMFIAVPAALACDFYFVTISGNLVCQLEQLGLMTKYIGDKENMMKTVDGFILSAAKLDVETKSFTSDKNFIVYCIKHQFLISKIVNKMESIYNFPNCLQLLCSVTAICASCFLLTNPSQLDIYKYTTISAYFCGHIFQLFIMCMVGSKISSQAIELSNSLYSSKWYQINSPDLRKDLLLFLGKTARIPKYTAFKIWELNYETCVQVLRLSFSFFTFLTKINGN